MNELELTGRACTHVVELSDPACRLHALAVEPFQRMRAEAAREGIDLVPVSAFRDFAAQARIWNEKFQGSRTLYNRDGTPLDRAVLGSEAVVDAILIWSALPGTSRHHWGSEIDVIDRAALQPGEKVRLLPIEYAPGGPFARLNAWLDRNMSGFGFFRPYRTDRGGVSPEPWHLSYAPVAESALEQLTEPVVHRALAEADIAGKEIIAHVLPDIFRRYVKNIDLR